MTSERGTGGRAPARQTDEGGYRRLRNEDGKLSEAGFFLSWNKSLDNTPPPTPCRQGHLIMDWPGEFKANQDAIAVPTNHPVLVQANQHEIKGERTLKDFF